MEPPEFDRWMVTPYPFWTTPFERARTPLSRTTNEFETVSTLSRTIIVIFAFVAMFVARFAGIVGRSCGPVGSPTVVNDQLLWTVFVQVSPARTKFVIDAENPHGVGGFAAMRYPLFVAVNAIPYPFCAAPF